VLLLVALGLARLGIARARVCGAAGSAGCVIPERAVAARGTPAAKSPRVDVVGIGSVPQEPPIPAGFLGVSLEYNTVSAYEGNDPDGRNPVLAQLIRNLAPGQTPIVRIGGDSTDWSWWPVAGMRRPPGVKNSLSPAWIAKANALVASTSARLILGINLEADNTALAGVEARQLLAGIGAQHLAALEIGNEPQLYPILSWYRTSTMVPQFGRPGSYDLADYTKEFASYANALPNVPLAGPSIGHSWLSQLGPFVASARLGGLVTFHAYAINRYGDAFRGRNCSTPTSDSSHPTVPTLLAPFAAQGLTRGLAPYIAQAHSRGLSFRVDELNAVTCAGTPGVSDTFASALWALDALSAMVRAGVDGVNVHTWRGSAGKLFGFSRVKGEWSSSVRPEYYGLLMFAQAAPRGSRPIQTTQSNGGQVQAWATLAPDQTIRLLLINESLTQGRPVLVDAPGANRRAQLESLQAPSANATSGVTLACQSFGAQTTTGMLAGAACPRTLTPSAGHYAVALPAASAALLTIPRTKA
jgi:hypothetical protein